MRSTALEEKIENKFPQTSTSRMAHRQVLESWSQLSGAVAPPGGHFLTQISFPTAKREQEASCTTARKPSCPVDKDWMVHGKTNTVWFVGVEGYGGVYFA